MSSLSTRNEWILNCDYVFSWPLQLLHLSQNFDFEDLISKKEQDELFLDAPCPSRHLPSWYLFPIRVKWTLMLRNSMRARLTCSYTVWDIWPLRIGFMFCLISSLGLEDSKLLAIDTWHRFTKSAFFSDLDSFRFSILGLEYIGFP